MASRPVVIVLLLGFREGDLGGIIGAAPCQRQWPGVNLSSLQYVRPASTPSCGTSRFGCWVCTVVDKDRSMEAMIKNDEEKVWMTTLLELRNELDKPDDRDRRDFRRMNGRVQLMGDGSIVVPGPYTKEWREHWLRRVLEAQQSARLEGPAEFRSLQLITLDELHEIRRIWL